MKIESIKSSNPSFGIKVPTRAVAELVSGEASDIKLVQTLTGLTEQEMILISTDRINVIKGSCIAAICKNPLLNHLFKTSQELSTSISKFIGDKTEANKALMEKCITKRTIEKNVVLSRLPHFIDLEKVTIPEGIKSNLFQIA